MIKAIKLVMREELLYPPCRLQWAALCLFYASQSKPTVQRREISIHYI
jgi:hypothetical protein